MGGSYPIIVIRFMAIDALVQIEKDRDRKAKIAAAIAAPAQSLKMPVLLADHSEERAPSISNILEAILAKRAASRRVLQDLLVLFEWPQDDLVATDTVLKDQSLTPSMRDSLAMQRKAWQLCDRNKVRHFSCMPVRPHADLFTDPWNCISDSIRWWHCLAGKLKDTIIQDSGDEIVMVLTDWSASDRGVKYSLKYVGAPKQAAISMFSGYKIPVSKVQRDQIMATCPGRYLLPNELAKVGQAQYTFQL